VLSALGSADAPVADVCSAAIGNLIPVMSERNIGRIVSVTGSAARADREIGSEHPHLAMRREALMRHMPDLILDGENHMRMLAASELAWTVARAPRMTEDDGRLATLRAFPPTPDATLSYQAAADAIITELLHPCWLGQAPFVAAE
jgi:hypothetical protein